MDSRADKTSNTEQHTFLLRGLPSIRGIICKQMQAHAKDRTRSLSSKNMLILDYHRIPHGNFNSNIHRDCKCPPSSQKQHSN